MTNVLVDDTASPLPPPSTNIEADRERALRHYENGDIGYRRYRSWMRRLDYQDSVAQSIKLSLAHAEIVSTEMPLMRERVAPPRRSRLDVRVGKFMRSL